MSTSERTVAANGVELHVVEAGPEDGFPVVLAHGFPELSYSWRHQMAALAAAGCRVLAPDQRGYGRSSRPDAIADYDIEHLTGDLVALLDDLGEEQAVFVGHDWGSMVVWQLALLAPERVAGVVGMSVPFLPRGPIPPVQAMRTVFGDAFFYILYFQEPGVADADLGRDVATTMRRMLCGLTTTNATTTDGRGGLLRGGRPRLRRPSARTRRAPRLADAGRARPLRGGVHAHRLPGWHQLVPELRSQLGADAAPRRRQGHDAVVVHRRRARSRPVDEPAGDHGRLARSPSRQRDRRRCRALGAAGEARRGQRRPRRLRELPFVPTPFVPTRRDARRHLHRRRRSGDRRRPAAWDRTRNCDATRPGRSRRRVSRHRACL